MAYRGKGENPLMFDVLVRGGKLVDGSGAPWRRSDVGIRNGRIEATGALDDAQVREIIDATGRFVCPGFIDAHAHTELAILRDPVHMAHVAQGVTTDITGMCGLSVAPASSESLPVLIDYLAPILGDYDFGVRGLSVGELLEMIEGRSTLNLGFLVPHTTLRINMTGMNARPPSMGELDEMRRMVEEAMRQGALGLSSGLGYFPTHDASVDELVSLCQVVALYNGIYSTHLRSYSDIEKTLGEAVEIGRRAGLPVHIAHLRLIGNSEGKAGEILSFIDRTRAEGIDLTFDCYPYLFGCTLLAGFIMPHWFFEGGTDVSLSRLEDPGIRARLYRESTPADWDELIIIAVHTRPNQQWVGRSVAEMAQSLGVDPFDACCDLLKAERLRVTAIGSPSREEDVRDILSHPAGMLGSDTILVGTRPHPRAYGTFSRFLSVYVRDRKIVPLEDAIRKITSFPARRFGLRDRGLVRPGMAADLVVFDFEHLEDLATYDDPQRSPKGIECVIVNGEIVIRSGCHTGALPGQALRL